MRCSDCGKCCEETMMELSSDDIRRLEEMGYGSREFAVMDGDSPRLRNVDGCCYFYDRADKKCRVYGSRPVGCHLYPVVYLADEGAIVEESCPMGHTISERELRRKAETLVKLLKKIDDESARRN